jgi:hypothetical protein
MMIRSVVLGFFLFTGCAVPGEANPPSGSAPADDAIAESAQAVTITCEQRCQLDASICESRCPRDPFDPQNDCGCGDALDLCKLRCSVP